MRVFNFDGADHRKRYAEDGWLHVQSGLTDDFLAYARSLVEQSGALDPLEGSAIQGAKTQYVFDFPDGFEYEKHLFGVVAGMTGWEPGSVTLSERHIKAYLPDAHPRPIAHKDRYASAIAVGLTLWVGEGSHVVFYPETDRATNPYLTAGLNDALPRDRHPAVILRDAPEMAIHDQPGDVLAFPGSSLWHLRRNSASTVLLYLKFNNFGCDPLGEDPLSADLRAMTTTALAHEDLFLSARPAVSRGFDSVARETGLDDGRTTWGVNVWRQGKRATVPVPEAYASLMGQQLGGSVVGQLAEGGLGGLQGEDLFEAVRRLAEVGALDLWTDQPSPRARA